MQFIPYEEIDHRRWNTTVNTAPNGNIYGYYWYLKAVIREWDAIVEQDYESVMPLPRQPLSALELSLLPDLGPYSVHTLNSDRLSRMLDLAQQHMPKSRFPISSRIPDSALPQHHIHTRPYHTLYAIDSYEALEGAYSPSAQAALQALAKHPYKLVANVKPEKIVEVTKKPNTEANTLLRIMYNAMHRGIGWSSGIQSKSDQQFLALSYFLTSHNKIYEIIAQQKDLGARALVTDLVIRNIAGKPMQLISGHEPDTLPHLGFEISEYRDITIGLSKWKQFFRRKT